MRNREKQQCRVIALIRKWDKTYLVFNVGKCLVEAIIPYLLILFPSFIVNLLYNRTQQSRLLIIIGIFFLIFLFVKLIFQFLNKQVENKRNHILNSYAAKKIEKVFSLKFELLETSAFEKIMQRIQYNDENFSAFRNYMEEFEQICRSGFQIIVALGIFIWITASVTELNAAKGLLLVICVLLSGIAISVAMMRFLQKWVNKKMPVLMDKIVKVNTIFFVLFEEVVQNYHKGKDVRLFGIDRMILDEGEKMIEDFAPHAREQIRLSQISDVSGSILSLLMGGVSFAAVGKYALAGYMEPGNIISFVGSIQQLSAAVLGIAFSIGNLSLWNSRMDAVFELFSLEEEQDEKAAENVNLETIEFEDVSFTYPESQETVLKHVSLTIRKGEKIAVVGPNGSGKSTFIKLLTGLYEPTEGRILLNGQDRSVMDKQTYRSYMAAVYQDFTMFSFTLEENIIMGQKKDRKKLTDVIAKLKLTEKVGQMKEGADTYCYKDYGENGRELSGGEAQKLAISRALYKDAPLVVLDEPTSALDPVSEYEIYNDFRMLVEQKTAVFVSHRLSSCRFCKCIFVFEKGQIIQEGNHKELLEKEGLYRMLWDAQAQYYTTK